MTDAVELKILEQCLEWERTAKAFLTRADAGRNYLRALDSPLSEASELPASVKGGDKAEAAAGSPEAARSGRSGTWTSVIQEFVDGQELGAPYSKVRDYVLQTALGPKLLQTDKSFYGALKKLEDAGQLVRKGGWAYSAAAYKRVEALVQNGQMARFPVEKSGHGESPIETAIVAYLASKSGFTASRKIIDHLIHLRADFSEKVSKNNTNAYNVLTRLVGRGVLLKDEEAKTYKLSQQHFPTESGSPLGEPVHREDSHSSLNGSSHMNGVML